MSTPNFEHLRIQYGARPLTEADLGADPLDLLRAWLAAAEAAGTSEPNGMALATVDAAGAPHCRIVLLKGLDAAGLRFFTNYESDKGRELAHEPRAALTFWWQRPLARQVRVEGVVSRGDAAEADAYFATRPRDSQLAATISPQSRPVADLAALAAQKAALDARLAGKAVPRPAHWGGYVLTPHRLEFWQGKDHRLHDRFSFTAQRDGRWEVARLAP